MGDDASLIDDLSEYIEDLLAATPTPGLSVALARRGELIWEAGFGVANVATGQPMTPQTVTRGGSMAKLYTAIAVLQSVERGSVSLFDPVAPLLPELEIWNPLGERELTIYDLLTFRSGLATDMTDCSAGPPEPLAEYLRTRYREPRLQEYAGTISRWGAKVGEQFQYSNLGFATLGYLVERTNPENLSFSDYVVRHILDPLEMTSTVLAAPNAQELDSVGPLSSGYAIYGPLRLPTPDIVSASYPACGLFTTPGDHIRLLLALQNQGGPLLSAPTVRSMLTPHAPIADIVDLPPGLWMGLGVMIDSVGQRSQSFGFSGSHPWGWWNDGRAYPELDCAIVVCANGWDMLSWHNPGVAAIAKQVCDFAVSWTNGRQRRRGGERRAWSWKLSYFVGLLFAERLRGLLGLGLSDSRDLLASVNDEIGAVAGPAVLEPAGFRAGLADMLEADPSLVGVERFLQLGASRLTAAEQQLAYAALGGIGNVPLPLSFWSR